MDRYTIPEISKILNMPRSTIIYHIREKKWLRADKIGRDYLISEDNLEAYKDKLCEVGYVRR